jgi:hypothetical protein
VLENQHIGLGDLFLFFGWFRETERGADGKLKYVSKATDLHIIYGYLQVGRIINQPGEIAKYSWHPHASFDTKNNSMYFARDTLSWDNTKSGYGVFQNNERLVLTKRGMSRSCWALPAFFEGLKITGLRADSWQTDQNGERYCRIANGMGQEFVVEENDAVSAWAKSLIDG